VQQPLQLTQTMAIASDTPSTTPAPEPLPALLVGANWETVLDSATRQILERQALAPYLARQRWFASKSRVLQDVHFSDWSMLRSGTTPAFLTLVTATYEDGWSESYVAPFSLVSGAAADRVVAESAQFVLARMTGARNGAIIDGMLDDDVCNRLLDAVQLEQPLRSARGTMRGVRAAGIDLPRERTWVRPGADSSNTVAFVSERYVLKLFRRVEPGPNPEFEIGEALTAQGFTRIATLAGAVLYDRPSLDTGTLAVVQASITNQGSGWGFTIDELRRYYERVTARIAGADPDPRTHGDTTRDPLTGRDADQPPPFFAALESYYLAAAATLGRRTAELHLALANATGPAFEPEPFDQGARTDLGARLTTHATSMLDLLSAKAGTLPEPARAAADAVLQGRGALLARLEQVRTLRDGGRRMRVHGDYHLGQVLRTEEDFVILDFEGEPARTLAERRAKYSPLKDVAGMLRSFQYAAYAALTAYEQVAPGSSTALLPWADTWQHWVSRTFLESYRQAMGASPVLPPGRSFEALLDALVVEKALYELGYELNNRPEWARIPLAALARLASPLQN
jgi:maltose alpha-D-glucosyltransferase/alpha-amylase